MSSETKTWKSLGVDEWISKSLEKILFISTPTEIQLNVIPKVLQGEDIIASAKTGSGKTLAFAAPILQKLAYDPYGVFALVLTPTRELAFQIAEQFKIVGTEINLKVSVVVGGMDMMAQALELTQKPHIVIATPGRLVDHIQSSANAIFFKRIQYLVLDEADRLLDDGFKNDLDIIRGILPKNRMQTLLLSATMTKKIQDMEFRPNRKPFVFATSEGYETVEKLDQRFLFIPSVIREAYLVHLLSTDLKDKTVIIFALKPKTCELIRLLLREMDLRSTALHSQMSQSDRIGSLAKFKSGIVSILVCTDVGSRGLDIPTVQVVINYQLPADPADYVHRIGRTARAGRDGQSISLVTERDVDLVHAIESKTGKQMTEYTVNENHVLEILDTVSISKRVAGMEMYEKGFGKKEQIRKEKKAFIASHKEEKRVKKKSLNKK